MVEEVSIVVIPLKAPVVVTFKPEPAVKAKVVPASVNAPVEFPIVVAAVPVELIKVVPNIVVEPLMAFVPPDTPMVLVAPVPVPKVLVVELPVPTVELPEEVRVVKAPVLVIVVPIAVLLMPVEVVLKLPEVTIKLLALVLIDDSAPAVTLKAPAEVRARMPEVAVEIVRLPFVLVQPEAPPELIVTIPLVLPMLVGAVPEMLMLAVPTIVVVLVALPILVAAVPVTLMLVVPAIVVAPVIPVVPLVVKPPVP